MSLDTITPVMVGDWMQARFDAEGNTNSVYKAYQVLRLVLNVAWKQQVIPFNPVLAVTYPKKGIKKGKRSRDRALDREQYNSLLKVCTSLRNRIMVRLAVEAGARSGELAGLRFSDIDTTPTPHIRIDRNVKAGADPGTKVAGVPKSGKTRPVAISQDLADELAAYFEHEVEARGADKSSYLFPGKTGRTGRMSNNTPQGRWTPGNTVAKLCKRAGLIDEQGKPLTSPHGLRATGATLAAASGVNPIIIQHQLGHADLRTTQESYLGTPSAELLAGYATAFE